MTLWPSGWEFQVLGDLVTVDRQSVNPDCVADGESYVGLEHIHSSGAVEPVSVAAGELKSSKFRFDSRHILYGKLRPYLRKIACPDFSGVCSTDILPLLPNERVERKYLFYLLRQPYMARLAELRSTGVNLPRLSAKKLCHFRIAVPSLTKQRRIVSVLDHAERLRQMSSESVTLMEDLVRATFLEMFGDSIVNQEAWPIMRLGDLLTESPRNGLYKSAGNYGRGHRIVRIDAFRGGEIVELSRLRRVQLDPVELEKYRLAEGDFLVNRVNAPSHLGKSTVVPISDEPVVFESNMMRLRLDQERISPIYLLQLFNHPYVRHQILQCARDAVNQSSINQADVQSFKIPVPPTELQERFEKINKDISRIRSSLLRRHALDNELFATLSQTALAGEV